MLLLPSEMEGGTPTHIELHRALEIRSVDGATQAKGSQNTILAGHRSGYELRTLLKFRVDMPTDVTILDVRLFLYVIRARGPMPMNLSVYRLSRDFEETQVTYDQAADGQPWNTPGGDYESSPLAQTPFTATGIDTISVGLDVNQLKSWLPGQADLPLIILGSGSNESMVEFLAREGFPTEPTASLLEVTLKLAGATSSQLLDRRAYMDATIVQYQDQTDPGMLQIGALPARQTFFRYDFTDIPQFSTINQAQIHLRLARAAFVDSFIVATYLNSDVSFVPSTATQLGYSIVVGERDTSLVMDVTAAVQNAVLHDSSRGDYIVLSSRADATTAGFVEVYPPTVPDSAWQPYISVIYSEMPDLAKPSKPGTELK